MSNLGYFVTYGIGESATTINAPDTVVPQGTGVVIKGTVMDQSPAQPNTPCVSDVFNVTTNGVLTPTIPNQRHLGKHNHSRCSS